MMKGKKWEKGNVEGRRVPIDSRKIRKEGARHVLVQGLCAIKIRSVTRGKSLEDGIRQDFYN